MSTYCLTFLLFQGVLEEAEFYNITPLIKLIKERIVERDSKATQVYTELVQGFLWCCSAGFKYQTQIAPVTAGIY